LNDLLRGIPKQFFLQGVNKKKLQGKLEMTYITEGKTLLTIINITCFHIFIIYYFFIFEDYFSNIFSNNFSNILNTSTSVYTHTHTLTIS
jgi:hypothetical protein